MIFGLVLAGGIGKRMPVNVPRRAAADRSCGAEHSAGIQIGDRHKILERCAVQKHYCDELHGQRSQGGMRQLH